MTDEIQNILEQPEISRLNGPSWIITIEPKRHGFTASNYLRVTELSTAVLRRQMKGLRDLDPSLDKELNVTVNENEGTPVITIHLMDRERP